MNKIIAVHLLNDYSGSPRVLSNFIYAASKANFSVDLITSSDEGFLSGSNCNITTFPYLRTRSKIINLISYLVSQIVLFFILLYKILSIYLKFKKKPVMVINTILPFGAALAAKLSCCKVVYYVHETSIRPKILKTFLKFVLSNTATMVIYVSNFLKSTESDGKKCEQVVYNSLGPSETPKEYTFNKLSPFTVFMPCSLKEYKGVYDFVELSRAPELSSIKFVLALNSDEREFEIFKSSISKSNLELHRRPKDMDALYKRANIVLNLSHVDKWTETFGMTVIEAFNYSLPVIVPLVGGPKEIIREGYDGFSIAHNDRTRLISTIRHLSINTTEYYVMRSNAFSSANKFQFEYYENKIVNILNEICSK